MMRRIEHMQQMPSQIIGYMFYYYMIVKWFKE